MRAGTIYISLIDRQGSSTKRGRLEMSKKVKLDELIKEVARESLLDALFNVKPKYKEKTAEELAEAFGLTPYQWNLVVQHILPRYVAEGVEKKIEEVLKNGDSLEVLHQFNIFVHESNARKNEKGEPAKKLSIRTRRALKNKLNQ